MHGVTQSIVLEEDDDVQVGEIDRGVPNAVKLSRGTMTETWMSTYFLPALKSMRRYTNE